MSEMHQQDEPVPSKKSRVQLVIRQLAPVARGDFRIPF
jgi:hypothetical protein